MSALTYRQAGVNIDAADAFIARIKPLVKSTARPEVLGGIGGFSGLFRPNLRGMKEPVLVSSTDGVGTKLMIADLLGKFDTVGIDLVAMSVDDVIVTGAEPLFFLDYIACGRLDKAQLAEVMKGVVKGCREANCALVGGETAELPGLYAPGQWDLAGFCVGLVDRSKIIDGRTCRKGDAVIGLASSGLHSNGYSLARGGLHREGAQGPDRPRAPQADPDLHPGHPRGPEEGPDQGHGPYHRRRLLRQHPAGHPGGARRPRPRRILADSPHLPDDPGARRRRRPRDVPDPEHGHRHGRRRRGPRRRTGLSRSSPQQGQRAYVIGEIVTGRREVTIAYVPVLARWQAMKNIPDQNHRRGRRRPDRRRDLSPAGRV